MKKILLIIIVLVVSSVLTSCTLKEKYPGWNYSKNLRPIWPKAVKEGITKITFCGRAYEKKDITKWYVKFDVPTESIPLSISFIETAMKKRKTKLNIWEIKFVKIVTKKNKYYVPTNWTDEKIYGNDWRSEDLRSFLREKGFRDPGTKKQKELTTN